MDFEPVTAVAVVPPDGTLTTSLRPALTVLYDGYLDPRRSDLGGAVSLQSGPFAVPVRVAWDPLDRVLIATPADPLIPGLRYEWTVDETAIVGAGGAPSNPVPAVGVTVARDAAEPEVVSSETVTFDDVVPLIEAHCGCHDQSALTPLDLAGLSGRATAFPGRRLVVPYEPASSYLVEKVLDDYPDRFGTEMPPPWSDGPRLDDGARRRIVEWIEDGAQP